MLRFFLVFVVGGRLWDGVVWAHQMIRDLRVVGGSRMFGTGCEHPIFRNIFALIDIQSRLFVTGPFFPEMAKCKTGLCSRPSSSGMLPCPIRVTGEGFCWHPWSPPECHFFPPCQEIAGLMKYSWDDVPHGGQSLHVIPENKARPRCFLLDSHV